MGQGRKPQRMNAINQTVAHGDLLAGRRRMRLICRSTTNPERPGGCGPGGLSNHDYDLSLELLPAHRLVALLQRLAMP